jgi:hypothetical protein
MMELIKNLYEPLQLESQPSFIGVLCVLCVLCVVVLFSVVTVTVTVTDSRALAKGMPWPGTYVRPQLPPWAADGLFPRRNKTRGSACAE